VTARQRDVKVRILSEYYDAGSKAAERATRRLASLQMAAAAEDARREQARADAIIAANRRQLDSMEAVGRTSLKVSAAIAIGLGLAAKAAMDWESAFAGVRKVVDGSPAEIAALEGELRGLAKVLPATHEEIAAVAEVAGQLGVARADIAAFTRTAIDMGETTNMAADEAATSMAQLSNIMGLAASQSSRLGSTIVELGNNGASTERDIVSMALRIAGAGRTVGMTADQVLAVSSALASVGLEAEAGGSAISRVLIRIDQDVSSGAKTLETYARVSGMTVEDFKAQWGRDATGALTRFITGLGDMQQAGGDVNGTLTTLGFTEIRVSDALRRAALAGDLLTDSVETGSRAWEENIALAEEASKRYQTTEARLEMARNRLNDAAIDVGANLLPIVARAAEDVGSLAIGFSALPEPVKQWATNLGVAALGLTAVVGGAAVVIPKLTALKATVDALHGGSSLFGKALGGTASVLTGPWALAIGGAVAVLGMWAKAQGDAERKIQDYRESLDQQTASITENTRATAYNNLEKAGAIEPAKRLGIALEDLVDAAIDPTSEAMRRVRETTDAVAESQGRLPGTAGRTAASFGTVEEASGDALRVLTSLEGEQGAVAESQARLRDQQAAGISTTEDTAAAQTIYNDVLRDGNQLLEDGAEAIDELARALEDLNGPALDAEAAESRYQEAVDAVTDAVEKNGRTTDLNTAAGRANRDVLRGLAEDAMKRANTLMQLTGDEDKWRTSLEEGRQALHEAALQMGMSEEAAWAYVDSVLAIPSEAAVTATFDAVVAEQQMTAFVNHWSGYNIPIYATMNADQALAAIQQVQRRAGAPVMQAAGGTLEFYAGSGIHESHVAQIAPAGVTRIWNEPETQGEGYVPLANDWRRPRAEATLGEIASRFGGAYLSEADLIAIGGRNGSVSAADLAAALNGVSMTLVIPGTGVREVARVEAQGVAAAAQAVRTTTLTQGRAR
jgi:TP901 family phage tail tape measure protein